MSRIVIIHPEGNFNNNPCLTDMVAMLCERGHRIRIVSPRRHDIVQKAPSLTVDLRLFDVPDALAAQVADRWSAQEIRSIEPVIRQCAGSADLVIGVDRGIVAAAPLARVLAVPLVLLSFEIFFRDEAGDSFKQDEKDACSDIALAICQDAVRGDLLARENAIPRELLRFVPVSGRRYRGGEKTLYWHERFNIPRDERIALFMGSIADWSMASYVLRSASRWASAWHLVMHHRYAPDMWVQEITGFYRGSPRIHFSDTPFDTFAAMRPGLLGADLGIALYQPIHGSLHEGHNLEAIGMASGKIAVYLQHGLPAAVNEIGEMTRHVREKGLGVVVDTSRDWTPHMPAVDPQAIRSFFEETLDLDVTFPEVMRELEALVRSAGDARV